MSNTMQLALILCVVVVLFVDVLTIIKNDKLQSRINICSELHKRLLAALIEQEDVISTELDELYDELYNNKIDKLIMQISDMDKTEQVTLCPFHDQVISAYSEWQSELANKIKYIKRKQSFMIDKMKKTLEVNEGN